MARLALLHFVFFILGSNSLSEVEIAVTFIVREWCSLDSASNNIDN